jgi:hypothetical protein
VTPQKQLFPHSPANGLYGDCHRAALASILDLPILDVPHFMDGLGPLEGEEFERRQRGFLATLGYVPIIVPYVGTDGLDTLLASIAHNCPNAYYLLGGDAGRGAGHTVVGYNDKIIHDPHPNNCGIIGPMADGYFWVTYIGKLFPPP